VFLLGYGTAWGGHLACTEKISWVQFPNSPKIITGAMEQVKLALGVRVPLAPQELLQQTIVVLIKQ